MADAPLRPVKLPGRRIENPQTPSETETTTDPYAALGDAELVGMARVGDHEAYRVLVERYIGAVTSLGYALTGDREAARDVAQEALSEGYRLLDQLRDPERFGGWVCGIARRRAIYHLRQRRRSRLVFVEHQAHESAPGPSPEQRLEADETRNRVLRAISELGEKYRVVLTLKYVEGMSYDRIAMLLGISRATVDKRLTRAKTQLRKLLERSGGPHG